MTCCSDFCCTQGVEISCEGVAQIRVDPGMSDEQARVCVNAQNDQIEASVSAVIREKALQATNQFDELGDAVIKGVPGVRDCVVFTVFEKDKSFCPALAPRLA